jgi:hypothetical protein
LSDLLDDIIKLVDSDPEVGFYITKYILSNDEKIQSFLDKHELEPVLFYPLGNIFYCVNLSDYHRKETQRFKKNKLDVKYLKQTITLMGLKTDDELLKLLKVKKKTIEKIISRNKEILALPKPERYNDKTILKDKLRNVFHLLSIAGKGQTEQINILLDLFEQEGFEDYKQGWSQERFDRIRKGYQEPAIKRFKRLYGK